jgi:hypothetical protein
LLDEYGVKADEMKWIETTESSDGAKLSPKLNRHFPESNGFCGARSTYPQDIVVIQEVVPNI